jgi:predicted dithiol-disulfide oxidoreductase (DUF899 family)
MDEHRIVSSEEWQTAARDLLDKEKDFTRARDELARARRAHPWELVTVDYLFDGASGEQRLPDVFGSHSQLVVYHFMFPPSWDAGCPHCSFWADNFDGIDVHLAQRDVTFVAVSRAPYPRLASYRERMGWRFTWLSSFRSEFNFDYRVAFRPEQLARGDKLYNYGTIAPGIEEREGVSVFFRDPAGRVFHTYSAYARGIDLLNGAYNFLDLVPKGRDEAGHENPQFWVRRKDEYPVTAD